jgi:hypothetical protein
VVSLLVASSTLPRNVATIKYLFGTLSRRVQEPQSASAGQFWVETPIECE